MHIKTACLLRTTLAENVQQWAFMKKQWKSTCTTCLNLQGASKCVYIKLVRGAGAALFSWSQRRTSAGFTFLLCYKVRLGETQSNAWYPLTWCHMSNWMICSKSPIPPVIWTCCSARFQKGWLKLRQGCPMHLLSPDKPHLLAPFPLLLWPSYIRLRWKQLNATFINSTRGDGFPPKLFSDARYEVEMWEKCSILLQSCVIQCSHATAMPFKVQRPLTANTFLIVSGSNILVYGHQMPYRAA